MSRSSSAVAASPASSNGRVSTSGSRRCVQSIQPSASKPPAQRAIRPQPGRVRLHQRGRARDQQGRKLDREVRGRDGRAAVPAAAALQHEADDRHQVACRQHVGPHASQHDRSIATGRPAGRRRTQTPSMLPTIGAASRGRTNGAIGRSLASGSGRHKLCCHGPRASNRVRRGERRRRRGGGAAGVAGAVRCPHGGARPPGGGGERAAAGPRAAATRPGERARHGPRVRHAARPAAGRSGGLPGGAAVPRPACVPLPASQPRPADLAGRRRAGAGRGGPAGPFHPGRRRRRDRLRRQRGHRRADRAGGRVRPALPGQGRTRRARSRGRRRGPGGRCRAAEGPGQRGPGDPPGQRHHQPRGRDAGFRHPYRAVRGPPPRALPLRRRAARGGQPAGAADGGHHLPHQDHVPPGHRRAAVAAGRPHQARGARQRGGLPRVHHPLPVRRDGGAARAGPHGRIARLRRARPGARRGAAVAGRVRAAERHRAGHRADRQRQDHHAVHRTDWR